MGVMAVLTSPCCGIGGLIGLIGLALGYNGLRSSSRGLSIFGMFASLCGVVLSVALMILIWYFAQMIQEPVPPNPDGTQAPFAH